MTLHSMWGWRADETWYRPIGETVGSLLTCARFGGNLLLNIGPRGDGSVDKPFSDRLQQLGDWLAINGEAIYGSRRTAMSEVEHPLGVRTCVGSRIYQVLNQRPGKCARLAGPFPARTTARLLGGARLRARTASDGVIAIEGLPRAKSGLPRVICLNARHRSAARRPSALLLLPARAALRPDEVPNLGVDPGRFQQDPAEVVCGDALAHRVLSSVRSASATRWHRGWRDARVLSGHGSVDLDVRPPVPGRYRLEVGVICDSATVVSVSMEGRSIARLAVPARIPDRVSAELRLDGGEILHLRSQGRLGVYGLRLEPVPRQIPSEYWLTFGHLPTGFRAGCDAELAVRQALRAVRAVPATGWRRSRIRKGDHSEAGVNFPYRCGPGAGICLARTRISSPTDRKATVWIGCDWWANALLNGEAVIGGRDPQAVGRDGAAFNGWKPEPAQINLRAGINDMVVICHPGSTAHWFTCGISDPGDLRISSRGLDAGTAWGSPIAMEGAS